MSRRTDAWSTRGQTAAISIPEKITQGSTHSALEALRQCKTRGATMRRQKKTKSVSNQVLQPALWSTCKISYHTPFSRWHRNGDHYPDKPRHRLSAEAAVGIRGYQAAFVELEEVNPLLEAPRAAAANATADVFRCSIIASTHQLHAAKAKAAQEKKGAKPKATEKGAMRPHDLRDQPPTTMRRSDISVRANYRRGKC